MPVVESTQTNTGSGNSIAVTKPVSLAVNDLLVGFYAHRNVGATNTLPSGFTAIQTQTADNIQAVACYKVATAGDVAASDFTFSNDGGSANQRVALSRITGFRLPAPITTSSKKVNASSATVTANTVTPTTANSLILFFTANEGGSAASAYALATSSPSFSELFDLAAANIGASGAAGTRPEVTATGSGTATLDSGASVNIGMLVVVEPPQSITVAESVTASETYSLVRTLNIAVAESIALTETVSTVAKKWMNPAKSSISWLNTDKND